MDNAKPILFPTDFRPHSDAAFKHAERLAAAANRPLVVLHVCNMPDMPYSTCDGMTHHEALKAKLKLIESSRVFVERVFATADPGPEICRLATELNCAMIVMGVTNKSGPDLLFCGGVHDYVEKNATRPLVTLCQQPQETKVLLD